MKLFFGDSVVKRKQTLVAVLASGITVALTLPSCLAQGPRPNDLGASNLDIGEAGIAWYTTWESAAAEAKRSGRPIMFVAAATQCHGISGVF